LAGEVEDDDEAGAFSPHAAIPNAKMATALSPKIFFMKSDYIASLPFTEALCIRPPSYLRA
jgi:hypothetical protein